MVFYSVGSALGGAAATLVYARAGWAGVSMLGAVFPLAALAVWVSTLGLRRHAPASSAATPPSRHRLDGVVPPMHNLRRKTRSTVPGPRA